MIRTDDQVDELHREMYRAVEQAILANPAEVRTQIHFIGLSRCLERIADLSTNIAEDAIYLIDGEIVRHRDWHLPASGK